MTLPGIVKIPNLFPTKYRSFRVTYSGPTDTKGSTTTLYDTWNGKYIKLPNNDEYRDAKDRAIYYLHSIGIEIVGIATSREHYDLLLTTDFSTDISNKGDKRDKKTQ